MHMIKRAQQAGFPFGTDDLLKSFVTTSIRLISGSKQKSLGLGVGCLARRLSIQCRQRIRTG